MPEDRFEFENLAVYQKALDYIDFIYQITDKLPESERYGFANNFRRAAQSIALNIGVGSGGTKPEFKKFLKISRRSVRECVVATTISRRRNYITIDEEKESRKRCVELSKMLSGLINSV